MMATGSSVSSVPDDDNADEFADAMEEFQSPGNSPTSNQRFEYPESVSLDKAVEDCREATNLFFDNKYAEARAVLEPWSDTGYYHALGKSVFAFLQAFLTFEQRDIESASEVVKQAIEISNRYRKKTSLSQSFGRMLKKPDYSSYTEDQVHAELCYAESMLLKAVLTFAEDETMMSFVKGSLKIRSCYQSYKECWHMLNQRPWDNDRHKEHFESGVRLGAGSFNLLISMLPQRILKLLEFIGFTGSRRVGFRELQKAYDLKNSVRRVLTAVILLAYHLFVSYIYGNTEGNLSHATSILEEQLSTKPSSAWFLFFKGRLEFVQAHVDEAIDWYERSWHSQDVWPQFHHMCFWELLFAHSMKLDWRQAEHYARRLFEESRWSKCIYAYLQAACLCMLKEDGSLSEEENSRLIAIMRDVPKYKQRIAGKSIPSEKFVIKKSERFFAQGSRLSLAAFEMIYLWNYLKIMGKDWNLIQSVYRLVERTIKNLENQKQDTFYNDNLALALLLKGVCLSFMGSPLSAEECLIQVTKMGKKLQDDTHLVPYSVAELGFLYASQDKKDQAIEWLESAKNDYKGYSLESRLHFRVHAALSQLKASDTEANGSTAENAEAVLGNIEDTAQGAAEQ